MRWWCRVRSHAVVLLVGLTDLRLWHLVRKLRLKLCIWIHWLLYLTSWNHNIRDSISINVHWNHLSWLRINLRLIQLTRRLVNLSRWWWIRIIWFVRVIMVNHCSCSRLFNDFVIMVYLVIIVVCIMSCSIFVSTTTHKLRG